MLICFTFQFGSPTLKYILQGLTKWYIDIKAAQDKISTSVSENNCEEPIARQIYNVLLTIHHMKTSPTQNYFLKKLYWST